MDLDEFDDDIPDEDFLAALDQASSSHNSQPLTLSTTSALNGRTRPIQAAAKGGTVAQSLDLDDLPSDAFSSPEPELPTGSSIGTAGSNGFF